jgi:hypothetical protein
VKCRVSATATKYWSCWNCMPQPYASIVAAYGIEADHVLDRWGRPALAS